MKQGTTASNNMEQQLATLASGRTLLLLTSCDTHNIVEGSANVTNFAQRITKHPSYKSPSKKKAEDSPSPSLHHTFEADGGTYSFLQCLHADGSVEDVTAAKPSGAAAESSDDEAARSKQLETAQARFGLLTDDVLVVADNRTLLGGGTIYIGDDEIDSDAPSTLQAIGESGADALLYVTEHARMMPRPVHARLGISDQPAQKLAVMHNVRQRSQLKQALSRTLSRSNSSGASGTGFRCISGSSNQADTTAAIDECLDTLLDKLQGSEVLNLLVVSCSPDYDLQKVADRCADKSPQTVVHGYTSGCKSGGGVQTNSDSEADDKFGVFGIVDSAGAYTTGFGTSTDPESALAASEDAVAMVKSSSSYRDDDPALLLVCSPLGHEEGMVKTLQSHFPHSAVVGATPGSMPTMKPTNCQLSRGLCGSNSGSDMVVITACWPSAEIEVTFASSYRETDFTGIVTDVDGSNTIRTIDNRHAATVYNEWVQRSGECNAIPASAFNADATEDQRDVGNVGSSCPLQLQRTGGPQNKVSYHQAHPGSVSHIQDGDETVMGLQLFASVQRDDNITMMHSSAGEVLNTTASISATAMEGKAKVHGALLVMCAGSRGYVDGGQDAQARTLKKKMKAALQDCPHYMTTYPLGEQGSDGTDVVHANLMNTVCLFYN